MKHDARSFISRLTVILKTRLPSEAVHGTGLVLLHTELVPVILLDCTYVLRLKSGQQLTVGVHDVGIGAVTNSIVAWSRSWRHGRK